MRSKNKAFTLVELLAVIAIIGILAGFIFAAVEKAIERARVTKTAATVQSLNIALTQYERDMGSFDAKLGKSENLEGMPTGWVRDATKREKLVRLLTGMKRDQRTGKPIIDTDVRETAAWQGPYWEPKEKELNEKGEPIDAWGKPLVIRIKVTDPDPHMEHRPDSFEIYSWGPNEEDDGGRSSGKGASGGLADDINNWD